MSDCAASKGFRMWTKPFCFLGALARSLKPSGFIFWLLVSIFLVEGSVLGDLLGSPVFSVFSDACAQRFWTAFRPLLASA